MGKRAALIAAAALALVSIAAAADGGSSLTANGVAVDAPDGWSRVVAAPSARVGDPRTMLVAGTRGVAPRASECQVAAYRIPADGAAVVILGWRGPAPDGVPRDRSELAAMRLKRPTFECWDGRGAVARIVLRGRAYQVNVMVGDRASRDTVADALAVARSVGTDN
jgi:hypothetical protein